MSPQLAETLKALRTERKKESLAKGWKEMPEWVFVNEVRQVIDEGNLRRRVFYPALAETGLRHIRFHDLRHTYASMLLQNGESLV
jgi:integrase